MIADRGREGEPPVSEIVVNPRSGQGRAHHAAQHLEAELRRRGHDTRVRTFPSPAEASHWARTCSGTFTHLFCVGGDGTLSRAATAAVRHRVPFVPVPFGFGNLFARAFRYSPDPIDTVRLLDGGVTRWVDVGQGPDGLFLSHRSFGIIENIQEAVETSGARPASRLRRALAYARAAIGAGRAGGGSHIGVDVDAQPICEAAAIVTVANVPTYRGVLELTPDASPADGLLDVAIVESLPALQLFATLVGLALRLPGRWRHVRRVRGRHVRVQIGERHEDLVVVPRALPILAPAPSLPVRAATKGAAAAGTERVCPGCG